MSPTLYSLLLLAALAVAYVHVARQAKPVVTICRCGDLVEHPPGWLTRCPSCGAFII